LVKISPVRDVFRLCLGASGLISTIAGQLFGKQTLHDAEEN